MSKDTNEKIDPRLDEVLRMMEQSDDLFADDIRRFEADGELMAEYQRLSLLKKSIQAGGKSAPDPDLEWQHIAPRLSSRRRFDLRSMWLGGAIGIAASLLVVLTLWWVLNHSGNSADPVMTFKADSNISEVTVFTDNGDAVAISETDENFPGLASLGGVTMSDSITIAYSSTNPSNASSHKLLTPRGKDFKIILADGTHVWLNAESSLEYPTFFSGSERIVQLTGEAFFDVAKDPSHPFIVKTKDLTTKVLGTEFNISDYSNAAPSVVLVSGQVSVKGNSDGISISVKPGQEVTLTPSGEFKVRKVDTDIYLYRNQGYFFFDDAPLSEIMQEIGRWYNVDVVFDNPKCMNYRMHYFCERNASVETIVTQLNMLRKVKATYNGGAIHIR